MNKQMKSAYFALRMKDLSEAAVGMVNVTLFVTLFLTIALCQHACFKSFAVVALLAALVGFLLRVVGFLCNLRIRKMGYDEIGLERMALA